MPLRYTGLDCITHPIEKRKIAPQAEKMLQQVGLQIPILVVIGQYLKTASAGCRERRAMVGVSLARLLLRVGCGMLLLTQ